MDDVLIFFIAANVGALLLVMFLMWFQSRLWLRIRVKDDDK
jgi:hypothetical protein